MRLITSLVGFAALVLSVAPAVAGQGGNNYGKGHGNSDTGATGPLEATISVGGASSYSMSPSGPIVSGEVTFVVTRSRSTDDVLWVSNTCYDAAGLLVVRTDTAALWGTTESLVASAGPMPTGGVSCIAYVSLRPWQDRPLKDAVISYEVE